MANPAFIGSSGAEARDGQERNKSICFSNPELPPPAAREARWNGTWVVLVRGQHGGNMQRNSFDVIRIPTNGPGDLSGLMARIDSGALEPSSILAVLGKTEGNGGVNDFTREYAVAALCNALSSHLRLTPHEVEARIA